MNLSGIGDKFGIGDIVEHPAGSGQEAMVVDINPGEPYTTPHPSIVIARVDRNGRFLRESCVQSAFARLLRRPGAAR